VFCCDGVGLGWLEFLVICWFVFGFLSVGFLLAAGLFVICVCFGMVAFVFIYGLFCVVFFFCW